MTRQSVTQTQQQTPTIHPLSSGILQRKCASCGQHAIAGGECSECQKQESQLQPHTSNQAKPKLQRMRRQSSNPATQSFTQSRFGHDFSQVPIHGVTTQKLGTQVTFKQPNMPYKLPSEHSVGGIQGTSEQGIAATTDISLSRITALTESKCPQDGSVRFLVRGNPVTKLIASQDLKVQTVDGNPHLLMKANKFKAEKTVITAQGSQSDLNDWSIGFSQTIQRESALYACYAPAKDSKKDPRTIPQKKEAGMVVQDIGQLAGGPVLDGDMFTSPNPPFYNTPDIPALPDLQRGASISMSDQPQTTIPIFFENNPSTGACLTKIIRRFKATAFVIAHRNDASETCFLWHINWGFLQTANPGSIALDASGNAELGNFALHFAEFPIQEGAGKGKYPSVLSRPLANTFGQQAMFKNLAEPCPVVGDGCVKLPTSSLP